MPTDAFDPLLPPPDPSDDLGDPGDLGDLGDLGDGTAPAEAGGSAAEDGHVLPGHDRPEWLLPVLVVAFGALIAWLVIFEADDDAPLSGPDDVAVVTSVDDESAAATSPTPTDEPASGASADDPAPSTEAAVDPEADPSDDPSTELGDEGGVVDPVAEAEAAAGAPVIERVDLDLPPPGFVLVGETEYPLTRSCVGLQPLAPNDTASVLSAHAFRPDDGAVQVVERWFTAEGIDGVSVDGPGGPGLRQVEVLDVTVPGSFAATLERPDGGTVELVVHPLPEDQQDCSQVVVTNAPGQFAFPYTRAAMAVCVDGDPVDDGRLVAALTEGARMVAEANGDGTHRLTLRTIDTLRTVQAELVDEGGELFAEGDRLGYSGLVTDGETSFDLTFDVDVTGADTCDAVGL